MKLGIGNKIIVIISVHILLIAINWATAYYINIIVKNDATVINSIGKIRGGVQKIAKGYFSGKLDQQLIEAVEENSIDLYNKKDSLIDDKIVDDFIKNYNQFNVLWKTFKQNIYCNEELCKQTIYAYSEELWKISDKMTLSIQKNNENKLNLFVYIFLILVVDVLLIIFVIYLIRKLINNSLEKDKIEQDKYIKLIDTHIITSTTDLKGIITSASQAFCNISEYTQEELIGKNHNIIRHPDMPSEVFENLWKCIQDNKTWQGEIKNLTKSGGYYWVHSTVSPKYNERKEKIGYVSLRQDITGKKLMEKLSEKDPLTNLYNRRKFDQVLDFEIKREERLSKNIKDKNLKSTNIFLFFIDIDNFKKYNDTYGHDSGDTTIRAVAQIIQDFAKKYNDWAFRIGGEEFAFIASDLDKETVLSYANELRKCVENQQIPHKENGNYGVVTISIGVSVTNEIDGYDITKLYQKSDQALYVAKKNGRNCCHFLD